MNGNVYWKIASRGGEIPPLFDLDEWHEAWAHHLVTMERACHNFCWQPSWENYDSVGVAMQRNETLSQIISSVATFLPGTDDASRKAAYGKAAEDAQAVLIQARPYVEKFLQKNIDHGATKDKRRAQQEMYIWQTVSSKQADCIKMEQALEREGDFLNFAHLPSAQMYPHLRQKMKQRAKDMGWIGYAVDPTDSETAILMKSENKESLRRELWRLMQKNTPITAWETKALLKGREQVAWDAGCNHWIGHLDVLNKGLTFPSIERQLEKSLKKCQRIDREWQKTKAELGAKSTAWKPKNEAHAEKPWNDEYLKWETEGHTLCLSGKEFPMNRVLKTIIPDMLKMGGWSVSGCPEKIGRGRQCLYLYRIHRHGKTALLYFAPYPSQHIKGDDGYQAYACMLRERWMGKKTTTPMVLISANFTTTENGLDDISALTYLAHEVGHVLHFLALPGNTFREYSRMPSSTSELPSILFEKIALDRTLLTQWCSPQYRAGKKISYWAKRLPQTDMEWHMSEMERACLDIRVHRLPASQCHVAQEHRKLREKTGLAPLHRDDRSAYTYFDRTGGAGIYASYRVGEALTAELLGKNPFRDGGHRRICEEMHYLLDNALASNVGLESKWKQAYGESLYAMFVRGQEKHDHDIIQKSKAEMKAMRRKIQAKS